MKGVHGSADTVPGKSMYAGANFHKKIEQKKRLKQYIFVGSIKVEIGFYFVELFLVEPPLVKP
jgi:hypothetical protein